MYIIYINYKNWFIYFQEISSSSFVYESMSQSVHTQFEEPKDYKLLKAMIS